MISASTQGVDDVLDQRHPHTYQDLSSLYTQAKQKVKSQQLDLLGKQEELNNLQRTLRYTRIQDLEGLLVEA